MSKKNTETPNIEALLVKVLKLLLAAKTLTLRKSMK